MSYEGPWRNRLRQLYAQYCYLDELETCSPKLALVVAKYGVAFDDQWHYGLAKHRTSQRQVVWRQPHWMLKQQSDKFAENGDKKHRKKGQMELVEST